MLTFAQQLASCETYAWPHACCCHTCLIVSSRAGHTCYLVSCTRHLSNAVYIVQRSVSSYVQDAVRGDHGPSTQKLVIGGAAAAAVAVIGAVLGIVLHSKKRSR